MFITKDEISLVVKKVLLYLIGKRKEGSRFGRTLALIPEFPIGFEDFISEYEMEGRILRTDFFTEVLDFTYPKDSKIFVKGDAKSELDILGRLHQYERLDILTPSLTFLNDLRDGRERDVFLRVALWFLMTDKEVLARLPYGSADLPAGRFGKNTEALLDDLKDMGLVITTISPGIEDIIGTIDQFETEILITEETVRQYSNAGIKYITAGNKALITPLAKELANDLGVVINRID